MSDDGFDWLQNDQVLGSRRRRKGIHVVELLDMPEAQRDLLLEITRHEPISLRSLTEELDRDPIELEIQISQMVTQGWLDIQEDGLGEFLYRTHIAQHSQRSLPPGIWQVVDDRWQVPIFRLFPEAMREEFSSSFELQTFRPGTILFEADDWGEKMYVVEQGAIELLVHNEQGEAFLVREIGPGHVVGEMAVLRGERRPYAAHVTEETQAWVLAKSALDSLLQRHPDIGLAVRQELARQLKPTPATTARIRHNPILAVGDGGCMLAEHLAQETGDPVVVIDLEGWDLDPDSCVRRIDGKVLRSRELTQRIHQEADAGSWVVVATLAKTSDQVMRATNTAEVVIDMTGSGASWLRATARQYWAMPTSTPQEMARLARKLGGRTTALILSGGMAHTLAQLGVIDVLVSAGISFDLLAGCGYGALWSALLALGWSPQQIVEWALQAAPRLNPLDGRPGIRLLALPGLYDARRVRTLIQDAVGSKRFSELVIPCCLAANDLDTGEVVWLQEGTVFSALSACIAAPGLVTPVEHQQRLLTDALLNNPLPADAAVNAHADIVLACSTIPMPQAAPEDRSRDLVTNWVGLSQALAYGRSLDHLSEIDLLIAPEVADLGPLAFEHAEQLIERGKRAAEKSLDRIRALF